MRAINKIWHFTLDGLNCEVFSFIYVSLQRLLQAIHAEYNNLAIIKELQKMQKGRVK
jgi:hypothetical protein